ncbi:DUF4079 domain-containing protein [Calothrix sp. CCY 0018]|uniref:DUF4079 domain-containing protein n=1 Tax=Calothrix sp. CCY 0018 TaxID=3103864 RepID=UPI0039C67AD9
MELTDFVTLIHPAIAIVFVFPLIGNVVNFAWAARQRRLQTKNKIKSKIPPVVGAEHKRMGDLLTGSVVGLTLLGVGHPITENIIKQELWSKSPFQVVFIVLLFAATIASLVLLYKAKEKQWRAIFATLTGMGIVILGCQDGVFRRTNEWYWSHYYYGIAASLLMVFSLAIVPEIYRDKTNKWRIIHTVINTFALMLFIGQGMTGVRDLLEIPLSWQKPFVFQCDFVNKTCS